MSSRVVDSHCEHQKRDLRLRIGRLRRRVNERIRCGGREVRRLASWRSYVRSWPGNAVAAAFGVGLALSAGLSARRLAGWLGMRLIRRAVECAASQFRRELGQIWADSDPAKGPSKADGAHDGGA